MQTNTTAGMIVIGNEILSGRTQDKNLNWIGKQLAECGIPLSEAVIVPDIEQRIIETVNDFRQRFTYVFTSGGIGPTHDDITTASVAKAFQRPVIDHPEAVRILHQYYKPEDRTPERMKMATTPDGASLIPNAVSAAPGFKVENVYVMAGVPSIFQSMFQAIRHELVGGEPITSISITVHTRESNIASPLGQLQEEFPTVDFGSYPFMGENGAGTRLVATSNDRGLLDKAFGALLSMLQSAGHAHEVTEDTPSHV